LKLDTRWKLLTAALRFALTDSDIDIVWVVHLLFLDAQLTLMEPRLGLFDSGHGSDVSGAYVLRGVMPNALSFFGDTALAEKLEKERVCVWCGPTGIFRCSHVVAFLGR
jgi:hypothetical protein